MLLLQDGIRRSMPDWLTDDQRARGFTADYLFHAATANWERKRPIWVMMMLNTLTRSDVASRGVPVLDLHLSDLARRAGKRLSAIEEAKEQCGPINNLGKEQVRSPIADCSGRLMSVASRPPPPEGHLRIEPHFVVPRKPASRSGQQRWLWIGLHHGCPHRAISARRHRVDASQPEHLPDSHVPGTRGEIRTVRPS